MSTTRPLVVTLSVGLALALPCRCVLGQTDDLYAPQTPESQADEPAGPTLEQVSLFFVTPPPPREIRQHDLVTIIIDEVSSESASQSLETEKSYETRGTLRSILDPWQLLELRLRGGATSNLPIIDAEAEREYEGEGDYERRDRLNARLTAEVIDVKPNGTLVLRATKRIEKDNEVQIMTLTGVARLDDVTNRNTVLSSQVASLELKLIHEGDVRDAAKKGLIPRILDTIFAF